MKPFSRTYTPIAALTTAFATTVTSTGVALTLTANAPTDALSHLITLTSGSSNDLSGLTFALVGLDCNGNPQTETIAAGPNSSTVSGSKYFSRLTSVTPSATMSAKVMSIGIGAVSLSPAIPIEWRSIVAASISLAATGTINVTVQDTVGDTYANYASVVPWSAISALTTKTSATDGTSRVGATAVQVVTNSVTNGATYTLWVSQPTQITG